MNIDRAFYLIKCIKLNHTNRYALAYCDAAKQSYEDYGEEGYEEDEGYDEEDYYDEFDEDTDTNEPTEDDLYEDTLEDEDYWDPNTTGSP